MNCYPKCKQKNIVKYFLQKHAFVSKILQFEFPNKEKTTVVAIFFLLEKVTKLFFA